MSNTSYSIVRTLRCNNTNVPGTLGKLTTTIGQAGAEIGNIVTVHLGHHYTVRDIDVLINSEEHLEQLINEVVNLAGSTILEVRDETYNSP